MQFPKEEIENYTKNSKYCFKIIFSGNVNMLEFLQHFIFWVSLSKSEKKPKKILLSRDIWVEKWWRDWVMQFCFMFLEVMFIHNHFIEHFSLKINLIKKIVLINPSWKYSLFFHTKNTFLSSLSSHLEFIDNQRFFF